MQLRTNQKVRIVKLKRAYSLFRTSWTVQAKLFFQNSTLHGVRYIAEKGRPFIERFIWFVCVAVSAVATMIIIVSLWEKFQTNPTITGLDTDFHNWDVAFPAITVCQSSPVDLDEIERYVDRCGYFANAIPAEMTKKFSDFFINFSQFSYHNLHSFSEDFENENFVLNDVDLKEFIFKFMKPCENVFTNCIWKSDRYNCCDGFFPVFTESGFCYTFNSRHYEKKLPWRDELLPPFELKYIKETDIKWSLKFDIANNLNDSTVPIFIHNSDDLPGVDMKPQHIWESKVDRISFSVKQTYTTEDTRQLSTKQRHCIFEDEIKLSIDHKYTYTACTRECRMKTAKKLCNCVPHFYPATDEFRHCTLRELKCIAKYVGDILSVDRCSCMLGCSNTIYEVQKFNENPEATGVEAEFVSWPMVRYKREVLFGWVDLLVSFGGIAGLFLGFSLLSGVEFLYYFTIRTCCMVKMEKEELKKIQRDALLKKKKSQHDMSLVPYFMDKKNGNELFKRNINIASRNAIGPSHIKLKKTQPLEISPFGIVYLN